MTTTYNFSAGPATLPDSVLDEIRDSLLRRDGRPTVLEIGHNTSAFGAVMAEVDDLLRELGDVPDDFEILHVHGGARMQFSAVPLNLLGRSPGAHAYYVETGYFAQQARLEASRYGRVERLASSEETRFDRIPDIDASRIDPGAAYVHITSNNTVYGTQWRRFPETGDVPLVVDATSDILSRVVDMSRVGLLYAGVQKNLGPPAMAVVFIRRSLLGHARRDTPLLLDYATYAKHGSRYNTPNMFVLDVMRLVLRWMKAEGGVAALEARNEQKARCLYDVIDASEFYAGAARPEHRSAMNVTFHLPSPELTALFVGEAHASGLFALGGHRLVGGVRASLYNAMPHQGAQALAAFMQHFEESHG